MAKTKTVFRYSRPNISKTAIIFDKLDDLLAIIKDDLECCESGEEYQFVVSAEEMSEEDFSALMEFQGW